jgi:hypothetical protein
MYKIIAAHPGPNFSVHDVHVGWVEALRQLGHKVAEFDLASRLTFYDAAMIEKEDHGWRKALNSTQAYELAADGLNSALYRLKPDILFVTSAFFYPPEMFDLVRSYGTQIVLLHTESPYEDNRQLPLAEHVDINLINDPSTLDKFRERNTRSYYASHSYRPGFHAPGPKLDSVAADFAMVGTGYPSRVDFLEAMGLDGLDVLLAGNWQLVKKDSHLMKYLAHDVDECIDNEQSVEIYRSSKIGLNLYRKEANADSTSDGWSCGPREIEMAACGMFYLREPRGEGDELFPMLPTVRTPNEATDELLYWLDHQDLRDEAALKARIAIEDRTFINRAKELMRLLDN